MLEVTCCATREERLEALWQTQQIPLWRFLVRSIAFYALVGLAAIAWLVTFRPEVGPRVWRDVLKAGPWFLLGGALMLAGGWVLLRVTYGMGVKDREDMRASLSEEGVRLEGEPGLFRWPAFARWSETRSCLSMNFYPYVGVPFLIIPKRTLEPAALEELRALLRRCAGVDRRLPEPVEGVEAAFRLTPLEMQAANAAAGRTGLWLLTPALGLLAVFLTGAAIPILALGSSQDRQDLLAVLPWLAPLVLLSVLAASWVERNMSRRTVHRDWLNEQRWVFSEAGVHEETLMRQVDLPWTRYDRSSETAELMLLWRGQWCDVIPKRCLDEAGLARLRGWLSALQPAQEVLGDQP